MDKFLSSSGSSSASDTVTCGKPTCKIKSVRITAVHQCPCGRPMHGFCGRGIGEEGYGQQRECTDCQKRTAGGKTGSSSSPMEVDDEDNEQTNSTSQPSVRGKGKRPAAAAGADGSVGKRPASAAATAAAAAPAAAAGAGSGAGGSTGAAKKCKASKPGSEHGKNKLTIAQRLQIVEADTKVIKQITPTNKRQRTAVANTCVCLVLQH
ncbi:unnamed protein product [Ectocarpus sp. 4 AP-2014]